jgi:hypothetical protein
MIDLNCVAAGVSQTLGTLALSGFRQPTELEDWNEYDRAFEAAVRWLPTLRRAASKSSRSHSYALKHRCEESTGIYTPNGVLIVAAIAVGLPIERIEGQQNAWVGVVEPRKDPHR